MENYQSLREQLQSKQAEIENMEDIQRELEMELESIQA
jgi:hypothetical protein